jgi:phenylpropionate dioxygenase-like ring-hydroxylating dioxygenase large terminal subunit
MVIIFFLIFNFRFTFGNVEINKARARWNSSSYNRQGFQTLNRLPMKWIGSVNSKTKRHSTFTPPPPSLMHVHAKFYSLPDGLCFFSWIEQLLKACPQKGASIKVVRLI